jgi:hypothetical protein
MIGVSLSRAQARIPDGAYPFRHFPGTASSGWLAPFHRLIARASLEQAARAVEG